MNDLLFYIKDSCNCPSCYNSGQVFLFYRSGDLKWEVYLDDVKSMNKEDILKIIEGEDHTFNDNIKIIDNVLIYSLKLKENKMKSFIYDYKDCFKKLYMFL